MRLFRVLWCKLFHRRYWERIPWQALPRRVRKRSDEIAVVIRCELCEEWWVLR